MPTVYTIRFWNCSGRKCIRGKLSDEELDHFDRHIVYKTDSWEVIFPVIDQAIKEEKKFFLSVPGAISSTSF